MRVRPHQSTRSGRSAWSPAPAHTVPRRPARQRGSVPQPVHAVRCLPASGRCRTAAARRWCGVPSSRTGRPAPRSVVSTDPEDPRVAGRIAPTGSAAARPACPLLHRSRRSAPSTGRQRRRRRGCCAARPASPAADRPPPPGPSGRPIGTGRRPGACSGFPPPHRSSRPARPRRTVRASATGVVLPVRLPPGDESVLRTPATEPRPRRRRRRRRCSGRSAAPATSRGRRRAAASAPAAGPRSLRPMGRSAHGPQNPGALANGHGADATTCAAPSHG